MAAGSLTVVGTGIGLAHVTPEARAAILGAEKLLYLVADPVTAAWLRQRRPDSRSLHDLYREGVHRGEIYAAMAAEIVEPARTGAHVCAAFYGHPGVFVKPSHDAVALARADGIPARMLPAVSAEDCLFADLGIDPSAGCQSYDATDFLLRRRTIDVSASLLLWQLALLGRVDYAPRPDTTRLPVLAGRLAELYVPDHEVVLYEASPYPFAEPGIERVSIGELPGAAVGGVATLYVPPKDAASVDPATAARLGIATA
jgi:hypothetical protein